eukprot:300455-Pelagomonas_calceolata.AAC.2
MADRERRRDQQVKEQQSIGFPARGPYFALRCVGRQAHDIKLCNVEALTQDLVNPLRWRMSSRLPWADFAKPMPVKAQCACSGEGQARRMLEIAIGG